MTRQSRLYGSWSVAHSLNITTSIGGVQIGEKIASVPQVLGKASQGVQSAVAMGGNRAEIFDPGAVDRAEEEKVKAWVTRIRDALRTALPMAPVAVRELLIHHLRERADPIPDYHDLNRSMVFDRPLHCPFTWKV